MAMGEEGNDDDERALADCAGVTWMARAGEGEIGDASSAWN